MAIIKDLAQVNAELQEQKERAETVDCKIITFSLAGKDYGVDIMNVKEIAKADKFTYVPNAASFVRGVYNLRGDIIPIIDLRTFFHLPQDRKMDNMENMLILRIADRVYGTIVDKIDKVVGINTENLQPPHPIFGDINIKYISGVVEKDKALYIILDVLRIFSQNKEEEQKSRSVVKDSAGDSFYSKASQPQEQAAFAEDIVDTTIGFIKEGLPSLSGFFPSRVNDDWIQRRFGEWGETRSGADLQLKNKNEADEFISSFYSVNTGGFWSEDYASLMKSFFPPLKHSNNVNVWNIGCSKGYESYSFACILRIRYPDAHIKIWANDSDIMAISQAPNMQFDLDEVPEYLRGFLVKGVSAYTFSEDVKDSIVFEYHDITNDTPLPALDIILARDVLSFMPEVEQYKLTAGFVEKMKSNGVVILGTNEVMPGDEWHAIGQDMISVFEHNG
ncbi:MAG: chemotaxis protein CheW [Treponema sp.]|jgi:purine-binding chemotaxis protein CheW|nr:chemotaxis protein CheW [Treponema sp.]